jgi:ribulose-5-phosphate 4-epimerase/fuculose-1-phosphate aldolase
MSIPVYLTAHADEFGGPIPCGGFALIGGEEIGQVVIEAIGSSPAVLLKNHGVFTIGRQAQKAALKAAVMVEDVAATVWLALQTRPAGSHWRRRCGEAALPLYARLRTIGACAANVPGTLHSRFSRSHSSAAACRGRYWVLM